MQTGTTLRVGIECRIPDIRQGHGRMILSLAQALSKLGSDSQSYTFIVSEDMKDWLEPHIFGACRLAVLPAATGPKWGSALRRLKPLKAIVQQWRGGRIDLPISDGFVEREGFDLVHFPTQVAYATALPSIYHPWDLQHLHYPEYFSARDIALRERYYRAFCDQAASVCVTSEWTKHDLVQRYGLDPKKIAVIRWGSTFHRIEPANADDIGEMLSRLKLPQTYFFYPAATWPHKNHALLLRAMHHLKTVEHRVVELCLTGAQGDAHGELMQLARELGLMQSVHYLGFVSAQELKNLYAGAVAMVFPSQFEGFGLPILEAFEARTPVLCSSSTVLPETAGDGAAYFDPGSPIELADLMMRVLDEPKFRATLIERGTAVLKCSSMDGTARSFKKLYDTIAVRS